MWSLFRWRKRSSQQQFPAWWQAYTAQFTPAADRKKTVKETPFIVFDTETTGLDTGSDRLLSIGAVKLQNNEIHLADHFECYLHFPNRPDKGQIEVHGILPVTREYGLEEPEAIRQFIGYIGNSVLVGHHVGFDLAMINKALQRMSLPPLRNQWLDTHQLAQRLQPPSQGYATANEYSLDKLCRQFGIPGNDRHTAAGDAFITALLLLKMLERLQKRGVSTLGALLR